MVREDLFFYLSLTVVANVCFFTFAVIFYNKVICENRFKRRRKFIDLGIVPVFLAYILSDWCWYMISIIIVEAGIVLAIIPLGVLTLAMTVTGIFGVIA